jgi:hypothetical protein
MFRTEGIRVELADKVRAIGVSGIGLARILHEFVLDCDGAKAFPLVTSGVMSLNPVKKKGPHDDTV